MSKYLFIGAHTDEELCFAGTVIKFRERGDDVETLFLSSCEDYSLKMECCASGELLGVQPMIYNLPVRLFRERKTYITDKLHELRYFEFVFTHSVTDKHPDHRTVAEESLRVFNRNVITYIGPWNGDEEPNYFVSLTEQQLDKKIEALTSYRSQAHRAYMNPDFIRSWAVYNGIKAGCKFAEGFKIQRLIA